MRRTGSFHSAVTAVKWDSSGILVGYPQNDNPRNSSLLVEAIVFLQDGFELVVGQRGYVVVVDAGHGFGGDHGVDDGFFRGFDGGSENGIE